MLTIQKALTSNIPNKTNQHPIAHIPYTNEMWSPRIPNNTSSMTTPNINNNNNNNNNSTDHLHLLFHQQSQRQQQQHYLIHLPSLRATPTTPTNTTNTHNNNTHSIQQQQQQPTCHIAHDSLPNSIAQMNLLLTTNNNNTILLHNVPIQLLSIIPSTPYAIATYSSSSSISDNNSNSHDQLFIIDLSNHGQLRQIFKYVNINIHLLTFSIIVFNN